jgi:hypothetical protein
MNWRRVLALKALLAVGIVGISPASGAETGEGRASAFGKLETAGAAEAKARAERWLRSAGKADAATREAVTAVWSADRPVLDKVAMTLALGDANAARLLRQARAPRAGEGVPAVLKDARRPAFFRANLALAYGKALAEGRAYEEALEALMTTRPEEVVDPGAYLFHKAVCEHALMLKDEADRTIDRLLVDVADAPERYRTVSALMHFDMLTWREKDLGWVARKMDNVQRRLALGRGGKQTRKIQREVLARLEEMIKELERPPRPPGDGPGTPGEPRRGGYRPPPADTPPARGVWGPGRVKEKKRRELVDDWGKLPPKERERIMTELTRNLPPQDRAVVEAYFKELARRSAGK